MTSSVSNSKKRSVRVSKPRVNLYLSDGQKKRVEEIMNVQGHANLASAVKYCFQRGLEVTCSAVGIYSTHGALEQIVDKISSDLDETLEMRQGTSNTLQESKIVDKTETIEFS